MTFAHRTRPLIVERDSYRLHAEMIAPTPPDAPWLVFGNSLVTDLSVWDAQATALAGRFGILRYDQTGHGRSGLSPARPTTDGLGRDLLAVMDAAGLQRAIYIGVSMGTPTGLAAHAIAKNRFAGLVLSDGLCRTAPGGGAIWEGRIALAQGAGMHKHGRVTADRWLGPNASPELRDRLRHMIAATSFEAFRFGATALTNYDYTAQLRRISCPTLLIAGALDGDMPQTMASTILPNITGSKLKIVPDAGHLPCLEQPDTFNALLQGFLTDHGLIDTLNRDEAKS